MGRDYIFVRTFSRGNHRLELDLQNSINGFCPIRNFACLEGLEGFRLLYMDIAYDALGPWKTNLPL